MTTHLKLRAEDAEDISVIAACLQDALIPVGDLSFLSEEQCFVLVANRFRWEALHREPSASVYERIRCGICFERVKAVRRRGIPRKDPGKLLEILTITVEDAALDLVFAGDAVIRLEIDGVHCVLEDFGEPWPTRWRPQHPLEE
ncbi:MAG: DUF2948 family protein [Alphaproteobacteria bacterium]